MSVFSLLRDAGAERPPSGFNGLTPGTLVELTSWFEDDTETGPAVGLVVRPGDEKFTSVVSFFQAKSPYWHHHLCGKTALGVGKPRLVWLFEPDGKSPVEAEAICSSSR